VGHPRYLTASRLMEIGSESVRKEYDRGAVDPGVWMINKKRWAVTFSEERFDPNSAEDVLGYVVQCADSRWRIEGDPTGQLYDIAQHAVQDLVRLHSTGETRRAAAGCQ
jgi:hypothetical protein